MIRPVFQLEAFQKATASNNDPAQCVHVARGMGWVLIRDTQQPFAAEADVQLGFSTAQFDQLQARVRTHNLRTAIVPAHALDGLAIGITRVRKDINVMFSLVEQPGLPNGSALLFTDGEMAAFFDGVHNGEFDTDGDYTAHTAECAADCAEPSHVALVAV